MDYHELDRSSSPIEAAEGIDKLAGDNGWSAATVKNDVPSIGSGRRTRYQAKR